MRFTLTMLPDGHAILSSEDDLDPDTAKRIQAVWDDWKATEQGLAIINNCTVQRAESVEIDLPVDSAGGHQHNRSTL